MEDSTSSVHYHPACAASPCCATEDSTERLSLLSSLTITDGFNVWTTACSPTSADAVKEHRAPLSPPAPSQIPMRRKPAKTSPPPQVCENYGSDDEVNEVLWHLPPPPPSVPSGESAPPSQRRAANADEGRVTAPLSNNSPAVIREDHLNERRTAAADADVHPTPRPRWRTVRSILSSSSSHQRRRYSVPKRQNGQVARVT
ncbi:hypothetical protein ABB37_09495 [Leptomonas pyrrhocoris]|uniref:Uncharacterized protein n=1 Tax=Leptomonas pyrrhocoris TaxID=157538 RepID=A0A0M9FQM3_LEPPY|nr:hypothetical protein ABB37_09495 [Leptomonas pyrrhocoris]KPA73866.1 hypothetical protein ABB37_09495 [Leptomonas pyrrhocoris]|eukprot:XP_015652305.1 hypothetical protein ABB37_09495 [Leptomonas pyrrhocoris]